MTVESASALPPAPAPALPAWAERSPVPAAMFNPALVATTIATAAYQYEETSGFPMPWPLAHLVTPLVLHTPTRENLPRSKATPLAKWAGDNAVLIAGFPTRARQMSPHVREGLRFGLREDMMELVAGDSIRCFGDTLVNVRKTPGDLPAIYAASGLIGRIFGRVQNTASVFAALRVQP